MEGQGPNRLGGSRLDNGKVGAAVAWWEEAHALAPWRPEGKRAGRAFRPPYHPKPQLSRQTKRRYHLSNNKEVFNAEDFTLYQALKIFEARNEDGANYTAFDSTAAFTRAMSDRIGPGQAFARAIIEVAERLQSRGCSITLRWVLAHGSRGQRDGGHPRQGGGGGRERLGGSAAPPLGVAVPPHEDDSRGQDPEHEGLNPRPRQGQPTVPPPRDSAIHPGL